MAEHTVEFTTGEAVEVSENETILRACLRAGIAQEYSCRVGMCLACCAEILEGEVAQPAAHALTDAERERYALTCMARPQSDLLLDRGSYPPSIEADAAAGGAAPADD
ncbi:MAG: 2Fe-2S iron-sulfur cluster binding domain-containing protein [Gemmatimonadetes bacterium]|nr:2Fe-2S iron-sulfur cluster binding domain-containing protein [Gemmatimonadota bacterium]NIS33013.1 2Fe-2S iron-sulfur cluster binding domain-containing protein [Actinomycetota bacterium]NIU67945.1 2Fe-2S iron-sulfur cluster binding domain-containing protein [Actinomycetota bacterium]NIV88279.1 2Fe-2S iron-sulfur cluster binding domain-containing protein [Actinomycetota bacterium]NIW29735.1 2Fe-2S iron-sulfur cluster binding domain-containing protein [Actinomycetota bacterium]